MGLLFYLSIFNLTVNLIVHPMVHASTDSDPERFFSFDKNFLHQNPEERFEKTIAVLKNYGIGEDSSELESELQRIDKLQTLSGYHSILSILDPDWETHRLPIQKNPMPDPEPTDLDIEERTHPSAGDAINDHPEILNPNPKSFWGKHSWYESERINVSKYIESKTLRDFDLGLSAQPPSEPSKFKSELIHFSRRLKELGRSEGDQPLQNFRVAIDPGHFGANLSKHDVITGKWIWEYPKGPKLRESLLTLQTAILVKKELEKLGATVFLTRSGFDAVYPLEAHELDLDEFARKRLRSEVYSNWFIKLIDQFPLGLDLLQAFDQSVYLNPNRKESFYSESRRMSYFKDSADLWSRVSTIEAFNPHLTLIIHYDVDLSSPQSHRVNPRAKSRTKVYIPGGLDESSVITRDGRIRFMRLAMDPDAWEASLRLSRSVVNQLSSHLKIPFDRGGGGSSFQIEPGVFARGLFLSRKLGGHAVTYIETLMYNSSKEFKALKKPYKKMLIDGEEYPYSERLEQAAHGILEGVFGFLHTY